MKFLAWLGSAQMSVSDDLEIFNKLTSLQLVYY